jgi:hypothetical protein
LDAAENADAEAATESGSSQRDRGQSAREAEAQGAEESRTGQVSELDRRSAALTAYLERESAAGFRVETRSDRQAVIVRKPLLRRTERRVVSVDEDGNVTSQTAQPVRW